MLMTQAGTNGSSPSTAAARRSDDQPSRSARGLHFADAVRERIAQTVVGQEVVVERTLIALLTGGHLLLEGMPGLAKTLLVSSVAKAVDLKFGRVQFTVDLLPSDVTGSEILDAASGQFRVHRGPIFTNLLLADEINRAAPKVQSALLEAMQERRVTIGNAATPLPKPFLVIATQNPVEQAGTFELPEAQLDRFMLCHRLSYPNAEDELQILQRSLGVPMKEDGDNATPGSLFDALDGQSAVASLEDLHDAMRRAREVHVSEAFLRHAIDLIGATRSHPSLAFGVSPRGGIAMGKAAQARAFLHGRDHVLPEDLVELAEDVLLHRMRVTYAAAAEGTTSRDVLRDLIAAL